ncbi:GNAT family N-acetyltransferase [Paenibacillus allorhizosphaerae]|uniref:N-acetyltransferase domain-containing protein n=1 Tax=Paenibacillus allorhizosphaerae TaxID=2849866 RepID=A0ABM8VLE5_9BACL|nr:GNAT family N-acetyltransferase [Paenibacillus allorhizosphaerae]CAG7648372.1 hypothetical protein PAECIP111802_04193 [Paenibacillus allorhizosphaerae]
MHDKSFYSFIDRLGLGTWPAQETELCGSWLLRASEGVTKRANSVWTGDGSGIWNPADMRREQVERFYKSRELPVRYHISDASPDGLDAWLDSQGYVIEVPCLIMTADAAEMAKLAYRTGSERFRAEILPAPDEDWMQSFIALEGHKPELLSFYRRLFDRITLPSGFVKIKDEADVVAVGTSVVENGWAGFTNVVVHPERRGLGIGKRLVRELAAWSGRQGAERLYLQVIADNEPAVRLYRSAGFTDSFTYHYRTKF